MVIDNHTHIKYGVYNYFARLQEQIAFFLKK